MNAPSSTFVTWEQLAPRGRISDAVRAAFGSQGRGTHALLFVDGIAVSPLLCSDNRGHAEENLLQHRAWGETLMRARAIPPNPAPTTISIVLNRTPCHGALRSDVTLGAPPRPGCSALLARTLSGCLPSLRASRSRGVPTFELIATGLYETHGPLENRDGGGPTTNFDLRNLMSAGWRIRVLLPHSVPSHRARILAQYVHHLEQAMSR